MEFLRSTISNYGAVFQIWYVLGLCVSLVILFFPGKFKRLTTVYLCCYTGIIFGALTGFRLFYHPAGFFGFAIAGTGILLVVCHFLSWGPEFVAAWVGAAKTALILMSSMVDEMTGSVLFTCVFIGLWIGVAAAMYCMNLTQKQKNVMWIVLCSIFGICELAGTVVALYRFPLESNLKFLFEKNEYCNYFSTWMNCDFEIVGNQDIFLMLLFMIFVMELVIVAYHLWREGRKGQEKTANNS